MFRRLLIANRGEIACRILRTARRLDIHTIAVYSVADRGARHVSLADEAHCIGPPPARDSYLNQEALLAVARAAGAEAVHPGYGFLAEDPGFAAAVAAAGLVFVGPTPDAIRTMGSKATAKRIMAAAGVPLLPGYHEPDQDDERLRRAAAELGFPLLIKAAAGGGGKGMRVVTDAASLPGALAAARREASAAFGDSAVILERFLERPRHLEVQVFGDGAGRLISLGERDCSVQRRYQKVLEEAPAPGLAPAQREALSAAALQAASAIDYRGAGTVEFIEQDGEFAFMEMNTRLQVEHPVTEMVLGVDLVEWQLRVAAGEPLPLAQEELTLRGHAVEARIYAEDPAAGFLPATGVIRHLRWPEQTHLRVDAGVAAGDTVGPYYDPMLAKIVAWGADRAAAYKRLGEGLSRCEIVGVTNNLALLTALALHPELNAGAVDTGFIARTPELTAAPSPPRPPLVLAALALLLRQQDVGRRRAAEAGEPESPWLALDGFRANQVAPVRVTLQDAAGQLQTITAAPASGGFTVEWEGAVIAARADLEGVQLRGTWDGQAFAASVVFDAEAIHVLQGPAQQTFTLPGVSGSGAELASGSLASPMPGQVIDLRVAPGDSVAAGDTLVIVEAMKMEHAVVAPAAGVVGAVFCQPGERVAEGVALVRLDTPQ